MALSIDAVKKLPPDKKLSALMLLARELAALEQALNKVVIGQPRYVRALLTGVFTKEHVALISPPGTAKSYLVKTLAKAIDGASFYQTLLNPYVTYDELFGPLDVTKLVEGRAQRKWSDLVRADFAFLDEGFKANPALLNSLLSFLNERVVYDPFTGTEMNVPLKTAVIASNEVPQHPSLKALWDRIAIRVYGKYITEPRKLMEAMQSYWRGGQRIERVLPKQHIELAEELLDEALRDPGLGAQLAAEITRGAIGDMMALYYLAVLKPFLTLHNEEIVEISNRTMIQKLPKIFIAEVLLDNARFRNTVGKELPSLAIYDAVQNIARYLAPDEDAVEDIEKALSAILGKSVVDAMNKLAEAYEALFSNDVDKVENALTELQSLDIPDIDPTLLIEDEANERELRDKIWGVMEGAEYLAGLLMYLVKKDKQLLEKLLEKKLRELEKKQNEVGNIVPA